GAVGFWEASAIDDDVILQNENTATQLHFLRQQAKKAEGQTNFSLADFICPASENKKDYLGAFAVTIHGIEKHIKDFEVNHDDYNKIILQALADRLAEAFAEYLHAKTRKEYWGYAQNEALDNEALIKESYVGIRPAPGYPACPDHTEKYTLFNLLDAEKHTGITLTESLAMYPASSVCGWYFANPQSQYFGLGKIQQDQVENYAKRKKQSLEYITRWLQPVID
ncbi:MAG: vitamin B12 dependent-methionine synthase activation domain-containing protein, partial [Sediminibacterium sp.]